MSSHYPNTVRDTTKNYGVPGVIYVLGNPGLRSGFYKIGSTRRSGWSKAMELNRDIHNAIPGAFECAFELHTRDCGRALESIYQELQYCRRGKKEQDYFELELDRARQVVSDACQNIDRDVLANYHARVAALREQAQQGDIAVEDGYSVTETMDAAQAGGVIKKAYLWMTAAVSLALFVTVTWALSTWTSSSNLHAATAASGHVGNAMIVTSPANPGSAIQHGFTGDSTNQLAAETHDGIDTLSAGEELVQDTNQATNQAELPILPASARDKLAKRLAALSDAERGALGLACLAENDKSPDAFASCLRQQLAQVPEKSTKAAVQLNQDEQSALEYACMNDKLNKGLPAYHACVDQQLAGFESSMRPASWSSLKESTQRAIQAACASDKYNGGPKAYDGCLSKKVAAMQG